MQNTVYVQVHVYVHCLRLPELADFVSVYMLACTCTYCN